MEQALIHRDALSAWEHLCQHGGIELAGRDEGLDEQIRGKLDPMAPTLEIALANATLEKFALAFFQSVQGFVHMFRDILTFFKQAGAKEGRDQWKLQLDNVELDLENFREWLSTWTDVANVTFEVPAVDRKGVSLLWEILLSDERRMEMAGKSRDKDLAELPDDVRAWVAAYNQGEYSPLPDSLLSPLAPDEFSDTTAILRAALLRISDARISRDELIDALRERGFRSTDADGLDFWTIAQNETDFWLRTFVVALSTAVTELAEQDLVQLGKRLQEITNRYPKVTVEASISINHLESILSLPIWQQRHELYSVWIATEILRALVRHEVEIHHDNGRITFPFKETKIATILSSPGPYQLISERRSPLANPVGKGRTDNVQPDHGLWTVDKSGGLGCRMCVEVKHYKKSGGRKFKDVLEDYGSAFQEADVYLVSHGPINDVTSELPWGIQRRCNTMEKFTSTNSRLRERFAQAVRECVGDPILRWPDVSKTSGPESALVFDVSGSMKELLRSTEMNLLVRKLIADTQPTALVAVDVKVVGSWPATSEGFAALLRTGGDATALQQPINELLPKYESLVLVTDHDGQESLKGSIATHPLQNVAPASIKIVMCYKT